MAYASMASMSMSAVDWSEFHVWCFLLQDVNKLAARSASSSCGSSSNMKTTDSGSHPGLTASSSAPSSTSPSSSTSSLTSLSFTAASSTSTASAVSLSSLIKDRLTNVHVSWTKDSNISTDCWSKQLELQQSTAASQCQTSTAFLAYAQFASGAIGGCTATYTTHWLDTIKVRMQTFPEFYGSGLSCLRHTVREEGVRALYMGATPAVLGQTCKTAVVFMCYGLCEELVRRVTHHNSVAELSVWQHAGAGAMTGVTASFVLCPLELIKCRLQALQQMAMLGSPVRTTSPFSMARHILFKDGLRGFYRGLPGIWVKEVPGSFIYFGSYETAKSAMRHLSETEHLSPRAVFISGMLAGLCFCVTHPIESVKTRVQVMSAVSENRGFMKEAVHIVKTEGVKPLCSGLKPSMLRACVYSGIQFLVYEVMKDFFIDHHRRS